MMAAPVPPIPTHGDTEIAHGGVGGIVQLHAFAEDPPQLILPLAAYHFLAAPLVPTKPTKWASSERWVHQSARVAPISDTHWWAKSLQATDK